MTGLKGIGLAAAFGLCAATAQAQAAGDWAHFEAVKSPFLDNVHKYPPNVSLGDWFEQNYPEHSQPASVRVLGVQEFLRQFAERLTDTGIPLLDSWDGVL